ncbi:MAG TPA: DUF2652 domain-containing protein, partial [Chitinophagaceae bacterium]
ILFYRFGGSPDLQEVYKQVEKMFCEFHKRISAYELRRFCQCKACTSVVNLTLKVITHYGEFTGYNVKNFNKLIGKDIIVAHQLLKNDIPQHEYWLVTQNLEHDRPEELANWMQWNSGAKQTETGEISFHYTPLTPLKKNLTPDPTPELEMKERSKMISVSHEYDAHIITMFHAAGDFSYRGQWEEGVIKVEELHHFLPRVGMKCRITRDDGESIVYASSNTFTPERIIFSETDENKKQSTYYTLERIEEYRTRLTIDLYIRKNFIGEMMFRLFKQQSIRNKLERSLVKLERVAQEINVPVEY